MPPNLRTARPIFWLLLAAVLAVAFQKLPLLRGIDGSTPLEVGVQLFALMTLAVLAVRWWLVLSYRSAPGVPDERLPTVTVIVPAFNEGHQVYETLRSLVRSDYPEGRLHVITINDGSRDDTWRWMRRAAEEHSGAIVALDFVENRGKRAALYEGFARAKGEVIVTVDSDSEVLPDTIRNLVAPLARDERVGAVAGNVRVLNREKGLIPRMLDVLFTCSFEFLRAAESQVDTVACCPGALSAYRRSLVEAHKDEWLAQQFLGRPCTIGEDRALTNAILKSGYTSKFQASAIVLTEVPETTRQLSKMLLRWARSNVRETLALGRFVFTNFRLGKKLGARVFFTLSFLRLLSTPFVFFGLLLTLARNPALLPWVFAATIVSGLHQTATYTYSRGGVRALWGVAYSVYSLLCLSWIGTYALFTARRSGWLTRQSVNLPATAAGASSFEARLTASERSTA